VVIPYWIVENELSITLAPVVPDPVVGVDDQRRHVEHLQTGCDGESALSGAEHQDLWVHVLLFLLPALRPVLPVGVTSMLHPSRPAVTDRLFMALELLQQRVQREDLPGSLVFSQRHHTVTTANFSLKVDNEDDAVDMAPSINRPKLGRSHLGTLVDGQLRQRDFGRGQVPFNLAASLDCSEGPCQGQVIAPVALLFEEQVCNGCCISLGQRVIEARNDLVSDVGCIDTAVG